MKDNVKIILPIEINLKIQIYEETDEFSINIESRLIFKIEVNIK